MSKRRLGRSELEIEPLVLGGNVFGWTDDEATSFAVLDAFVDAGFNAIDTADVYSRWLPGHQGGESETILGKWMKSRGNRSRVVLMTKVGADMGQGHNDLSARWIEQAVENSLRRLQTDVIDLYQSHWPDPNTPQEETLTAHDRLIKAGKVRAIGSSNQDVALLTEALEISKRRGLARYETIQNEFNLYSRDKFEGPVQDLCVREGISGLAYYGLAAGFLTGKYRSEADFSKSPRGARMAKYLDAKGRRILSAMDAVSARTGAALAEIAIAWIIAQPGIGAPIASATSVQQLESLVRGASLQLSPEDLRELTDAGR